MESENIGLQPQIQPEPQSDGRSGAQPAAQGNYFFKITVTEAVLVLLTLLLVLVLKLFFAEGFDAARGWYDQHLLSDTDTREVLDAVTDGGSDAV